MHTNTNIFYHRSLRNIFNKSVHVPYYTLSEKNGHNVNFATFTAKKSNATLYPNESLYFPLPVGFDRSPIQISTKRNVVNGSSKIVRTDGKLKFTNSMVMFFLNSRDTESGCM